MSRLTPSRTKSPRAPEHLWGPRFWRAAAERWQRWEARLLYNLSQVDPVLFRAVELSGGDRVLDLACGTGEPSLTVARFVGARGRVIGMDVAEPMVAIARMRARRARLTNVRFQAVDMARLPARGARFDAAVSRFGLMFADDPVDVLRRIRSRLAPGGRFAAAVWGPPGRNPSHAARLHALRPFGDSVDANQTGSPLALSSRGLLARLLREAGFADVGFEAVKMVQLYSSVDEFVNLQMDLPMHDAVQDLSARDRETVRRRLRSVVRRFRDGDALRVPAMAWVAWGAVPTRRH